ncbi:hypothetical protein CNMCM7691_008802 [Aspergillus felis]|uniref:AB hydrolase-1 domain-containing protein n=1 Tax=Aspergillus felis TaxID=1287682 RepID=A0A8H6QXF0_9EURO|nr:hypothetical protein CNMCM7691_008802 [Aspergillus felis]
MDNIQITGLFKRGRRNECSRYPLIVLIHGGSMNAAYFDDSIYSTPRDLSDLGYDVLNIHRPGHGPNPIPDTQTPFEDGLPVFVEFIAQVYEKKCKARGGIILIGHS